MHGEDLVVAGQARLEKTELARQRLERSIDRVQTLGALGVPPSLRVQEARLFQKAGLLVSIVQSNGFALDVRTPTPEFTHRARGSGTRRLPLAARSPALAKSRASPDTD